VFSKAGRGRRYLCLRRNKSLEAGENFIATIFMPAVSTIYIEVLTSWRMKEEKRHINRIFVLQM